MRDRRDIFRFKRSRVLIQWTLATVSGLFVLGMTTVGAQAESPQSTANPIVINETQVNGVPMISDAVQSSPQIVSQAAVVMDMTTGTVVYAKNPLATHYPASLTKMLTALVALDKGKLSDELTVSKQATEEPPDKLYLVPGETEPLGKLLYGMLLNSANDAAVVIAQHYGGSVQGFAKMMNAKAQSLGAVHTHFVNPTGLPDDHHVTTAYDLALIARAAMSNPVFRQIVATKYFDWQGAEWQRNLMNINSMLFTYPGAIGIKTGYTSVAHETLAVAATHGNQTFLAILLDARLNSQIDTDATHLLNFAFKNYQSQTILDQGKKVDTFTLSDGKTVPVYTTRAVLATVPVGEPLQVQKRIVFHNSAYSGHSGMTQVGDLQLTVKGKVVASEPVVAKLPVVPAQPLENTHTSLKLAASGVGVGASIVIVGLSLKRRRKSRLRRPYQSHNFK